MRSAWLKQRALSEYRGMVRVTRRLAPKSICQIWPKLNVFCDSKKRNGNYLFLYSKHSFMEAIGNNANVKTALK